MSLEAAEIRQGGKNFGEPQVRGIDPSAGDLSAL